MRLIDFKMFWTEHNPYPCSTSLLPYHHQDSYKVRESLSGCLIFLFLPSYSWLQVFTYYCLSLPLPTIMHHFGCDIGRPHLLLSPAPRCLWSSENDVQLDCLSLCWKMEGWHRIRSRWHCTLGIIFSDKLGLELRILAFACYRHSHQNITMKIKVLLQKRYGDFKLYAFKCHRLWRCAYNIVVLIIFFIKQNFVYKGFFYICLSPYAFP